MEITCKRCGAEATALDHPPIPTDLGRDICDNVCPSCWQEWLGVQVMLINEYRLNLIDPRARAFLETEMRRFFNLGSTTG
jgi:Fe-S cluster biosynthesis and repair protein YggX